MTITTTANGNALLITVGGKTARSKFEPRAVTVDWENLPADSRAFITLYGLKQYLADGTAGAESQDDFNAGIDSRLAKLASGDLSRKTGERDAKADTPEGLALKLAKAGVRAKLKEAGKTADADTITAAAKVWVEKNPEWLKEATAQLARGKKLAEASDPAALLADLGIDLD